MTVHTRKILLAYLRLPVVARLWLFVGIVGIYTGIMVYGEETVAKFLEHFPSEFTSPLGMVLGMLLVFRTNTAYDRWWEGRKLWGQLVNDSRNLMVKVKAFVKSDFDDYSRFGHLIVGFANALKDHLRLVPGEKKDEPGVPRHLPVYIIMLIYEQIGFWNRQGQLDGFGAWILDKQAGAFSDILGACERIRKTPLTASYRLFVRTSIFLYLASFPIGLVGKHGYWTIPATMIVAYLMLGLEVIAHDVEEPFGVEHDDLPLDEICRGIDASVNDIVKQDYETVAEEKGAS